MGYKVEFNEYTASLLLRFTMFDTLWLSYMSELAAKMGTDAREHIKPFTTAKSEWNNSTHGTGSMANSVKENVTMIGSGFGITFNGNFYGNYLDVGNFPASTTISRPNGKQFPVGLRAGQAAKDITVTRYIHGIGNYNPKDWPAHFSDKTANWLAEEGNMQKYCDDFIGGFLRELIMP
jgi:hypothetical protein